MNFSKNLGVLMSCLLILVSTVCAEGSAVGLVSKRPQEYIEVEWRISTKPTLSRDGIESKGKSRVRVRYTGGCEGRFELKKISYEARPYQRVKIEMRKLFDGPSELPRMRVYASSTINDHSIGSAIGIENEIDPLRWRKRGFTWSYTETIWNDGHPNYWGIIEIQC